MATTDRQRFSVVLATLGEVYGKDITEVMAEAYWRALRDCPMEAIEAAAVAHIRESRWFPKPVELVEGVEDFLRERLRGQQRARLKLTQSTELPLSKEQVADLVENLGRALKWPGNE